MMSFTNSFVVGSRDRPDLLVLYSHSDNGVNRTLTHTLNEYGYTPGLSSVMGIAKSTITSVHIIYHTTIGVFTMDDTHFQEANLGIKNFERTFWEMIPFYGNMKMYERDQERKRKIVAIAERNPDVHTHVLLLDDEGVVAKILHSEFIEREHVRNSYTIRNGLTPVVKSMTKQKDV